MNHKDLDHFTFHVDKNQDNPKFSKEDVEDKAV